MIRTHLWRGVVCGAIALILAGCGSDNNTVSSSGSSAVSTTKAVTATGGSGGPITAGTVAVTVPANALSKDANVTVTQAPTDLPTTAKTTGLVTSVKIAVDNDAALTAGTTLTLTLPTTRTNTYPIYAYKVNGSQVTEVDAVVSGSQATIAITSFGTYAIYNASLGSQPGTPQATVLSIAPQENAALYGTVRLRVKNLLQANAPVAVTIGGVASTSAVIAYTDATVPTGTTPPGGAIDFRVPNGLTAGAQNLIVTVNGVALPAFSVTVSDTNPFAVFTLDNGTHFVGELRRDAAPITVDNFVGLATGAKSYVDPVTGLTSNDPVYNNTFFHRSISGFVRQGGDPTSKHKAKTDFTSVGSGQLGAGFPIAFEVTGLTHEDGAIAMASTGAMVGGSSQFYICDGPQPNLNGNYAVFGKVIEGLDKAKAIALTYNTDSTPITGAVATGLTTVVITGKLDTPAQ